MIESFLKYLQFQKRVSAHTSTAYKTDLDQFSNFLAETFSEEKTEFADYGMIRTWIVSLVEAKMEPSSINRKIAALRTYFKFLLKQEVISKNPMTKIRVLKTSKRLPSYIRESEIDLVLDGDPKTDDETNLTSFQAVREKLILELFYATGIRLSELLYLKEGNVNLSDRSIKVLGKRNKERVIPFGRNLVPVLKEYITTRNKEVDKKDHGFLLVTENGEPCYPMLVYRIVRNRLKSYPSIEKKSPHVLRHTYATHLLNNGAEINAVKDLLGHASLAATQVYTHNSIEKLKKAFEQAHPKA
jgi:integrase/recombinase XerC